jgi:hypothetical protein
MTSLSGIKILTFPPHTSSNLQPLDLTVFGPFKTYYNQALDAWHINNPGKKKYPEELRIFALTLNFYSSSAYNYVRKTFAKSLPHPKTLQKWYSAVDESPGYTKESLQAIKIKVQECAEQGKSLVCSLVRYRTIAPVLPELF